MQQKNPVEFYPWPLTVKTQENVLLLIVHIKKAINFFLNASKRTGCGGSNAVARGLIFTPANAIGHHKSGCSKNQLESQKNEKA